MSFGAVTNYLERRNLKKMLAEAANNHPSNVNQRYMNTLAETDSEKIDQLSKIDRCNTTHYPTKEHEDAWDPMSTWMADPAVVFTDKAGTWIEPYIFYCDNPCDVTLWDICPHFDEMNLEPEGLRAFDPIYMADEIAKAWPINGKCLEVLDHYEAEGGNQIMFNYGTLEIKDENGLTYTLRYFTNSFSTKFYNMSRIEVTNPLTIR